MTGHGQKFGFSLPKRGWSRVSATRFWPSAALGLVFAGGCLGPNPDFLDQQDSSPEELFPTATQAQETPTGSASQSQGSGHADPDPSLSPGPNTTADGENKNSPSTDDNASPSGGLSTASTPSLGSSDPGTNAPTSSDTTSSQSTDSGVPSNWKPIVIDTRNATQSLPVPYALSLTIDHSALVSQGATVSGSDLAIVHRNGSTLSSLSRVLDPDSGWGRRDTRIWFAPALEIPPGQVIENEYFLVWSEPSVSAVQDHSKVFLVYDDFAGPQLNTNIWSTVMGGSGSGQPAIIGGQLSLYSRSFLSTKSHSGVELKSFQNYSNFAFESRTLARSGFFSLNCSWSDFLRIHGSSPYDHLVTLEGQRHNFSLKVRNPRDADLNFDHQINTTLSPQNEWHRLAIAWNGTEFHIAGNDNVMHRDSAFNRVPSPAQSPIKLGFRAQTDGFVCALQAATSELLVEWALVRRYVPGAGARLQ